MILLPGIPEGNYDVVVFHPRKKGTQHKAGFRKAIFVMAPDFNADSDGFNEYML